MLILSVLNSNNLILFFVFIFSTKNAIFDTIGRNVILPCKTVGRPHPEVYWMDTENNIVDMDNDRYKVYMKE